MLGSQEKILGSQEKILEPKVNVKFFTVDPYTPCNRVSRPFPIWRIWQIWPLLGQNNMFFGGLVKRGNQKRIVGCPSQTCILVVSSKGEIKY